MVGISFDNICQDELGLSAIEQTNLKTKARSFLDAWNTIHSSSFPLSSNNTYDDNVQGRIASMYLENGWNSGGVRVAPGSKFWPDVNTGSVITKYSYPRDRTSIIQGLKKLFIKIQEGQARYQSRKQKRNTVLGNEQSESEGLPDVSETRTEVTPEQPRRQSDRIKKNINVPQDFDENDDRTQSPTTEIQTRVVAEKPKGSEKGPIEINKDMQGLAGSAAKSYSTPYEPLQSGGDEPQQSRPVRTSYAAQDSSVNQLVDEAMQIIAAQRDEEQGVSRRPPFPKSPVKPLPANSTMASKSLNARSYVSPNEGEGEDATRILERMSTRMSSRSRIPDGEPFDKRNGNDRTPDLSFAQGWKESTANIDSTRKRNLNVKTSDRTEISSPKRLKLGNDAVLAPRDDHSPTFMEPSRTHSLFRSTTRDTGSQISGTGPLLEADHPQNQAAEHRPSQSLVNDTLTSIEDRIGNVTHQSLPTPIMTQSIYFFILKSRHPRLCWMDWSDAKLEKETIDSTFEAVSKYSQTSTYESLEIKFETKGQQHVFQISRGRVDQFERMKQCIIDLIEDGLEEEQPSKKTTTIRIIPNL